MKTELAAPVVSELVLNGMSAESARRTAFQSHVSFVSLRKGALSAILIKPPDEANLCAANWNDNCPSWLFQRSGEHVTLLVEDFGEGLTVVKTIHNGMRDLVTRQRVGHTPVDYATEELHFDGKQYQPAICSESIEG
jgi:hypothetical protein